MQSCNRGKCGVEPLQGFTPDVKTDGPGKLCQAYHLTRDLNGACAFANDSQLWVEDRGEAIDSSRIARVPRIGVDYAREYKDKPWRFYIMDNPWVSRPAAKRKKCEGSNHGR